MATVGLYGSVPNAESVGLYGNNNVFGGTYFEWLIFQVGDTQPATPTGGSWDFTTNIGTPPSGWLASPPANPTNTVWVSVGLVNSRSTVAIAWSAPGKFSYSAGLPILSGTANPSAGDGVTDQLYIQTSTTPETIWFKQVGTWTRITGSTLYMDLTNSQTIAGTKTFSSPIAGSVTGTSANVTGIVAVANGGTGVTTSTGTGSVVLNNSPLLLTPTLSGATVDNAAPYLNFTPTTAPAHQEGRLFYDSTAHTLNYYNDNSEMSVNIGQETIVRVRNQTGATIADGSVVYVNGATGNTPTIALALANTFTTSDIVGVTTTSIANNGFGYVTINGLVNGLNTSAFTEGQAVFVSATVAGAYTATEPVAPNYSVQVGVVLRANPSNGTLLVSIQAISTEVSHIVGTMLIGQGGTGQTTANGAFNALAPSQAGNTGKYLTTDGSNTSWAANPLGTVTSVAATVPSFLSITGSPITTSGTLAFGLSGTALPTANGGTGLTSFTANGVVYASSTSALATGSALTFDGTNLGVGTSSAFAKVSAEQAGGNLIVARFNSSNAPTGIFIGGTSGAGFFGSNLTYSSGNIFNYANTGQATYWMGNPTGQSGLAFGYGTGTAGTDAISSTEQMRLTSTGLGIGTSSPAAKLDVTGTVAISGAVTLSGGTANGVSYLNGSKVLTTGSALTFSQSGGTFSTTFNINSLLGSANYKGGIVVTEDDAAFTLYGGSGYKLLETQGYSTPSALKFYASNSEQMRLTTTGLGIGTSSPTQKLDVQGGNIAVGTTTAGNSTASMTFGKVAAGGGTINNRITLATYGGAYGAYMEAYADLSASTATYLAFGTTPGGGGSPLERMRLDSAGNLGLGVTPSSWTTYGILNLKATGAVISTGNGVTVGSNWYFDNDYRYAASSFATWYEQLSGQHKWYTAASGTAGAAISFTQAMTLDASGNLLVGTTNTTFSSGGIRLYANNSLEVVRDGGTTQSNVYLNKTSNDGEIVSFNRSGTQVGNISVTTSATAYNTTSDYRLKTVIGSVSDSGARIDALEPVEYTWNSNGERTRGFLAHKFQEVYAGSVTGTKDAVDKDGKPVYQAMQAGSAEVIADLVAELQSLRKRLAALEAA